MDVDIAPQPTRGSQTKQKILQVSLELFSQKSFKSTTVRDIASAMGVKPSALYNHFKNKNEILETLIQELSSSAIATLFSENTMDTGKTLLFTIALTFKQIGSDGQNEALYRLLMQEMFRNERIREIYHDEFYQENVIKLSELFFVMMQEKRILSFDPILLANSFLSPLFFYQMQLTLLKLDHKSTSEVSAMFSKHVEFFWDTIQIKETL